MWSSRFDQPPSPSQRYFIEPRMLFSDTPLDLYTGNVLLSEYRQSPYGAGLDLGLNFHPYGQARRARMPLFEGVYGGLAYETADMPQLLPMNDKNHFQSGTAYLSADTSLGVACFGLGYANGDDRAVYLYLGNPF